MACEGCNLSNKFHSLANVFAPVLLSVQYCLFVQCWPGSFLVQCREDLCNNNTVFAATSYYKKINQFGIKIAEKLCYSDGITLGFFLCDIVWSLWATLDRVFTCPVQGCSNRIATLLNRIFSCAMLSGSSSTTLHKVFTCGMFSKEYQNNIEQDLFLCNFVWSLKDNIS